MCVTSVVHEDPAEDLSIPAEESSWSNNQYLINYQQLQKFFTYATIWEVANKLQLLYKYESRVLPSVSMLFVLLVISLHGKASQL